MIPTARRAPAVLGLLCAVLVSLPSAAGVAVPAAPAAARPAHWLHVRVWEAGSIAPNVSVRLPTALVSVTVGLLAWTGVLDHAAAHASCPHAVSVNGRELSRLWSSLLRGGASQLVAVHSGDGSAVEIALE
jgi:hypothetical protein